MTNKVPEMNTAPSATCQEYPITPQTVMAKKRFRPIPGARAMGYLASSPISSVARALEIHVATITAPLSIPVEDRTAGCTKMI